MGGEAEGVLGGRGRDEDGLVVDLSSAGADFDGGEYAGGWLVGLPCRCIVLRGVWTIWCARGAGGGEGTMVPSVEAL